MQILERLDLSPELLRWALAGAVVFFVASLIVLPFLVIAIPRDYFAGEKAPPALFARQHPAVRWTWRVLRNGLGALMALLGLVMLVTPGQGLLTLLVGLMLLEFPGKRRLEQGLVARPAIHRHLNWIRRLAGRPPLTLPGAEPTGERP